MTKPTTARPISRYPTPALDKLPEDIRAKILEVQEKAGFVPNVFLAFAHRPDDENRLGIWSADRFCRLGDGNGNPG